VFKKLKKITIEKVDNGFIVDYAEADKQNLNKPPYRETNVYNNIEGVLNYVKTMMEE